MTDRRRRGPGAHRAPGPRPPGEQTPGPPRRRAAAAGAGLLAAAVLLAAAAAVVPSAGDDDGAGGAAAVGSLAPPSSAPPAAPAPSPAVPADRIPGPAEVPVAPATPRPAERVPAPVRVVVAGTPIDMPVLPVGIEDDGAMTLPDNHVELGWYRHGPAPGAGEGAAVIAGHVDTLTEVTPMARLQDVRPGTEVVVERADGSAQRYRTEAVEHVHKRSLEDADLFRRDGAPALHLVTCGGEWLEEIGDYEDNVVLRAVPVD
ncbi:class F sortase [Kocuria flava]|uniref:class F sortase n=1 Tax=Kocuria flava TaxID=446860 RepID=UPI002F922DAF